MEMCDRAATAWLRRYRGVTDHGGKGRQHDHYHQPRVAGVNQVNVEELDRERLPALAGAASWRYEASVLAPRGIAAVTTDSRWRSTVLVALMADAPVGLLPVFRSRGRAFAASKFDPRQLAPGLFQATDATRSADEFLLIGGSTELVAGYSLDARLTAAEGDAVGAALVARAFQLAGEQNLTAAAVYVRDSQINAFRGPLARPAQSHATACRLDLPGGGLDGYLAGLPSSRRSIVRRDWRDAVRHGLVAGHGPAEPLLDEAVPLVHAVTRRHQAVDHPILIRMRMARWAALAEDPVAFWVRDRSGSLLAFSLGSRCCGGLELYDVGLVDGSEARHAAYTEVLVYGPLRYALDHGLRSVSLGIDAVHPKILRGARAEPVWAVAAGPCSTLDGDRLRPAERPDARR